MKNKEKWIIMIPGGNPMKEKGTVQEKTIVIDIKLTRGLVVALSCALVVAGLLAYLTLTGERAAASETETAQVASTGMRQFYLTEFDYPANAAKTACVGGYHFASLWELADPSNLKYNTSLGAIEADSGQGPRSELAGWVRTGYTSNTSTTPGQANCAAWTTVGESQGGTTAVLPSAWTSGVQDMGVWYVNTFPCNTSSRVWCIED
jgi:hypothetical protein